MRIIYQVIVFTAFRTYTEIHIKPDTALARKRRWNADGYKAEIVMIKK